MITKVPMITGEVNPKLEYRMLVFSNITRKKEASSFDDLMVLKKLREPVSKDEIELLKSRKILDSFKEKGINTETVKEFISEFNLCVDDSKVNIVTKYINDHEQKGFDDACELLMFVVKSKPFINFSYKFAIIAFNAILLRNSILPIIFYTYPALNLFELVESGLTIECLKDIIMQMFEKSIDYNTSHELITSSEIVSKIQELKNDLIEKFDINEAYITGSFANGLFNKYSDLDLIVKMEHYEIISEVEKYLSSKLGIPVDCIKYDDPFTEYSDLIKYRIQVI